MDEGVMREEARKRVWREARVKGPPEGRARRGILPVIRTTVHTRGREARGEAGRANTAKDDCLGVDAQL